MRFFLVFHPIIRAIIGQSSKGLAQDKIESIAKQRFLCSISIARLIIRGGIEYERMERHLQKRFPQRGCGWSSGSCCSRSPGRLFSFRI
jgi:hypothetical protein